MGSNALAVTLTVYLILNLLNKNAATRTARYLQRNRLTITTITQKHTLSLSPHSPLKQYHRTTVPQYHTYTTPHQQQHPSPQQHTYTTPPHHSIHISHHTNSNIYHTTPNNITHLGTTCSNSKPPRGPIHLGTPATPVLPHRRLLNSDSPGPSHPRYKHHPAHPQCTCPEAATYFTQSHTHIFQFFHTQYPITYQHYLIF